ncbi:MAG: hypothetical protein QXQ79_00445 [Candidatus Nanoarchaeia archaeon]
MLITTLEVIQIIITILAIGFIFSPWSPWVKNFEEGEEKSKFLNDLKLGILVAAPAVILHELAHKLVALMYGFSATYFASWWGLSIGVLMKIFIPGVIFFIPGYVSIQGQGAPLDFGLIAFAGPLINLILFGIFSLFLLKDVLPKYWPIWSISKRLNLWLFIFNMLPIPGLDGFKFYTSLIGSF